MVDVTVYVQQGDPACDQIVDYLKGRGIEPRIRDVLSDPSASAILFGRVGRVIVPSVEIGSAFLAGADPIQLARFLPSGPQEETGGVSLGAAIRTVSAERSRELGTLVPAGAVEVGRVTPGSAAEDAGLCPGDFIVGIGSYLLGGGAQQLRAAIALRRPGEVMELDVVRGTEHIHVLIHFREQESPASAPGN